MTAETENKTYQGYANYETWSVALIVDNDPEQYEARREDARMYWENATAKQYLSRSDVARHDFADGIEDNWTSSCEERITYTDADAVGMMVHQLLGAALSEINWHELADTWLNEEINENGAGGYEVAK